MSDSTIGNLATITNSGVTPATDYIPVTHTVGVATKKISILELYKAQLQSIDTLSVYVDLNGAVGDGVTDDTVAINNALATIPSTGGRLIFSAGKTYAFSNTLWLPNNLLIEGNGAILKAFGVSVGSGMIRNTDTATANNIHIRDLNVDMNEQGTVDQSGGHCFVMDNVDIFSWEGCSVINSPTYGFYTINGSQYGNVINCYCLNMDSAFEFRLTSQFIHVIGCHATFGTNSTLGFTFWDGAQHCSMIGCSTDGNAVTANSGCIYLADAIDISIDSFNGTNPAGNGLWMANDTSPFVKQNTDNIKISNSYFYAFQPINCDVYGDTHYPVNVLSIANVFEKTNNAGYVTWIRGTNKKFRFISTIFKNSYNSVTSSGLTYHTDADNAEYISCKFVAPNASSVSTAALTAVIAGCNDLRIRDCWFDDDVVLVVRSAASPADGVFMKSEDVTINACRFNRVNVPILYLDYGDRHTISGCSFGGSNSLIEIGQLQSQPVNHILFDKNYIPSGSIVYNNSVAPYIRFIPQYTQGTAQINEGSDTTLAIGQWLADLVVLTSTHSALSANVNVIFPANYYQKWVINTTVDPNGHTLTIKTASGTGFTMSAVNKNRAFYCDGTNLIPYAPEN